MTYQISTFHWLQLDTPTRMKIAEMFQLNKSGNSRVFGSKIMSDGYTNEDLAGVSVEKMNSVMGTTFAPEEVLKAFEKLVTFINTNQNTTNERITHSKDEGGNSTGNAAKENDEGTTGKVGTAPEKNQGSPDSGTQ